MFTLPSWCFMTCVNLLLQLTVVAPADEYNTCMHSGMTIYTVMLHKHSTSRCILSTPGVLTWMRPCGIVVMLTELFTVESKYMQLYMSCWATTPLLLAIWVSMPCYWNAWECVCHLFLNWNTYFSNQSLFCYDDECHLQRYATNLCRRNLSIQLANTEIVVDKLHMAGHTDTWCRNTVTPNLSRSCIMCVT